jgi:hypothetical protein
MDGSDAHCLFGEMQVLEFSLFPVSLYLSVQISHRAGFIEFG